MSSIGENEVHVWLLRAEDAVGERSPEALARHLSPDEIARAHRFRFDADRDRYVLGRGLTRTLLSRYAATPPGRIRFAAGDHGRPFLADADRGPGLDFNLSHTDGLVAVAIARGLRIGVDVESMDTAPPDPLSWRNVLSEAERRALGQEPEGGRGRSFLEIWTLKEAYVKARGEGHAIPVGKVSFDRRVPLSMRVLPPLEDDPRLWRFHLVHPTARHVLAVGVRVQDAGAEVSFRVGDAGE